jgi:alkylation response protein AidB-like acyl-CoA dehydrogenase
MSINSMALPPIIKYGAAWMQEQVVRPVVTGNKNCSLMISEPYAGSDVANIRTTAVKQVGAARPACWRAARADPCLLARRRP